MMKNELQNWSLGDGFGDGRKLGLGFGFFLSWEEFGRREEERE